MYLTARQLEQILRETGKIVLPFGARLTPAAQDLVRLKKLELVYDLDAAKPQAAGAWIAPLTTATPAFLWWSGVKSGTAKAAIAMSVREANLKEMAILEDSTKATAAIRHVHQAVKGGTAAGGVIVVEHGGLAVALANRSPYLRAIVGTSLAAVDAGVRDVAANVLVIEPGTMPLMVIRNMILRFVRTPRTMSEELAKDLNELAKL